MENEVESTKEVNEKIKKEYVEKSSMPKTRNAMILKHSFKRGNKYQSRNVRQNKVKRNALLKRQKRLEAFGWSLFMF